MRTAHAVIASATLFLGAVAAPARAQVEPAHRPHWEFIVSSGKTLPTGEQRAHIRRGNLTVAQLSYAFAPAFAVTGSIGWTRTRDIARAGDPKVDMFTYDVGGELRADRIAQSALFTLTPFVGAGAGGRSYTYRRDGLGASHGAAAYGSAGGELGIGSRVRVRLEVRDYVTRTEAAGGTGAARNDVSVMAGLRLKVR